MHMLWKYLVNLIFHEKAVIRDVSKEFEMIFEKRFVHTSISKTFWNWKIVFIDFTSNDAAFRNELHSKIKLEKFFYKNISATISFFPFYRYVCIAWVEHGTTKRFFENLTEMMFC